MRPHRRRRSFPDAPECLEQRLAMSGGLHPHAAAAHHVPVSAHVRPYRPTVGSLVIAEINSQFNALTADVHRAEAVLAQSLANQAAASSGSGLISIAPVDNTAVQYQVFLSARITLMDRELITELDALPIRLSSKVPGINPVQLYVNDALVGTQQPSLLGTLPLIPLPTPNNTAFVFYASSVDSAIANERIHIVNGVTQLFLGRNVLPTYLQPPSVASQRG